MWTAVEALQEDAAAATTVLPQNAGTAIGEVCEAHDGAAACRLRAASAPTVAV